MCHFFKQLAFLCGCLRDTKRTWLGPGLKTKTRSQDTLREMASVAPAAPRPGFAQPFEAIRDVKGASARDGYGRYGSKLSHQELDRRFECPSFHLPGFHFEYIFFWTHSQMRGNETWSPTSVPFLTSSFLGVGGFPY